LFEPVLLIFYQKIYKKTNFLLKKALLVEDLEENDDNLLDNHTIINLEPSKNNSKLTPTKPKLDGKLGRLQNQVEDVVDAMKTNIEKVVDRGQSLNDLNDRSENLSTSGQLLLFHLIRFDSKFGNINFYQIGELFSKRARNVRKSMWIRTCRARLYLGLTLGFILILIICKYSIYLLFSQITLKLLKKKFRFSFFVSYFLWLKNLG
jgi:hypothetical protein